MELFSRKRIYDEIQNGPLGQRSDFVMKRTPYGKSLKCEWFEKSNQVRISHVQPKRPEVLPRNTRINCSYFTYPKCSYKDQFEWWKQGRLNYDFMNTIVRHKESSVPIVGDYTFPDDDFKSILTENSFVPNLKRTLDAHLIHYGDTRAHIAAIDGLILNLEAEVADLRNDLATADIPRINADIATLRTDIAAINTALVNLPTRAQLEAEREDRIRAVDVLRSDMDEISQQLSAIVVGGGGGSMQIDEMKQYIEDTLTNMNLPQTIRDSIQPYFDEIIRRESLKFENYVQRTEEQLRETDATLRDEFIRSKENLTSIDIEKLQKDYSKIVSEALEEFVTKEESEFEKLVQDVTAQNNALIQNVEGLKELVKKSANEHVAHKKHFGAIYERLATLSQSIPTPQKSGYRSGAKPITIPATPLGKSASKPADLSGGVPNPYIEVEATLSKLPPLSPFGIPPPPSDAPTLAEGTPPTSGLRSQTIEFKPRYETRSVKRGLNFGGGGPSKP